MTITIEKEKEFIKNRILKNKVLFTKDEFIELQESIDKDNTIYIIYEIGCLDTLTSQSNFSQILL